MAESGQAEATGGIKQRHQFMARDIDKKLQEAVSSNRLGEVELLLQDGAQFDPEDEELLQTACMQGGPEILALLISKGLNANKLIDCNATMLDWVEDFRKFLLKQQTDNLNAEWEQRLLNVGKVLFDAGVKRACQMKAVQLGTWLHVTTGSPTGLFTNTGAIATDLLPGVGDDFITRFRNWHETFWRLWHKRKEENAMIELLAFDLNQNAQTGSKLAKELRQYVGSSIEVSYMRMGMDSTGTFQASQEEVR